MLALKLLLVPLFLLLLTLAGWRWGAAVAGWLAGLPVVVGPILFFLALEQGTSFAAGAAASSLAAVVASVAFFAAYAHGAIQHRWPRALATALVAWLGAAMLVWTLPATPAVAAVAATLVLALGTRAFPPVAPARVPTGDSTAAAPVRRTPPALELCARMLAGALLVLAVTGAATLLGTAWSGMLAVFPVVGSVLAVFSHQTQGPVYTAALLRAMTAALPSLALFCLVVAVVLPRAGIGASFVAAIVGALAAHAVVRRIALPRMADATLPRQRR